MSHCFPIRAGEIPLFMCVSSLRRRENCDATQLHLAFQIQAMSWDAHFPSFSWQVKVNGDPLTVCLNCCNNLMSLTPSFKVIQVDLD